jgi:uncharacterized membrane protein YuzA (DUF378 family)
VCVVDVIVAVLCEGSSIAQIVYFSQADLCVFLSRGEFLGFLGLLLVSKSTKKKKKKKKKKRETCC